MICCSDVFLEISDCKTYIDVYLLSLALCPTEYGLTLSNWVVEIGLNKRSFAPDDLVLDCPNFFFIRERPTGKDIYFPTTIKLGIWQCYRIRKLINGNEGRYWANVKLLHGGHACYLKKKTASVMPLPEWQNHAGNRINTLYPSIIERGGGSSSLDEID